MMLEVITSHNDIMRLVEMSEHPAGMMSSELRVCK